MGTPDLQKCASVLFQPENYMGQTPLQRQQLGTPEPLTSNRDVALCPSVRGYFFQMFDSM